MGIPLVRNNSVDDINTSIIAIKKELGKGGSGDMGDVNVNVDVKYEVTDTVEDGNSLPVTSQGVYDYVEGQGFTPVDEVAINNMKAVTSNAVAESLSYSTTEQKTGGKWIDGKPIYRKVFSGTVPSTTVTSVLDTTSMNVDTVITIYGVAFYNNTQQLSIPNKFMSFEKNSPNSNCIGMASDAWSGNPFTCVIEYTKAD